jgi:hypothetical protein
VLEVGKGCWDCLLEEEDCLLEEERKWGEESLLMVEMGRFLLLIWPSTST